MTTHPAFRNATRMVARMYDALHDPAYQDVLTRPTDTGDGGFTHPFFRTARTVEDLVADRDAIAEWARTSYGWMGRSPDYKAAFLGTLGANADFYDPYQDNAKRWYKDAQERCLYFNHAIVNPPIDRDKGVDEVRDVFVHVERETDDGLVVSGAKVVATGSALTNYNFIAHYGAAPIKTKEFAVIFAVPMDAPGLKLICRPSYELHGRGHGQPVRLPAVQPARRERLDPDLRRGPRPVGERLRLRRRRQDQRVLPGVRVHPALHVPRAARASRSSWTSSPACC